MSTTETPVNATDAVVEFVQSALPPDSAISDVTAQLDAFRQAAQAGANAQLITTLRRALSEPGQAVDDAWLLGTAGAGSGVRWIVVCAVVAALESDSALKAVTEGLATRAVAVGYAVADALATAVGRSHSANGWALETTAGAIGGVAAAACALGLDADRLRHAIGIAATQAAGLKWVAGTDAGALQLGKAASNAVEAALMASHGFTSGADSLSGRRGLFALMSTDSQPSRVAESLAAAWP